MERAGAAVCRGVSRRWRTVSSAPRRTQDRSQELQPPALQEPDSAALDSRPPAIRGSRLFRNEPDTDWSLPQNGEWAKSIHRTRGGPRCDANGGRRAARHRRRGNYSTAGQFAIRSIRRGRASSSPAIARRPRPTSIGPSTVRKRMPTAGDGVRRASDATILHRAADELAAARGELMGAMLAEGGKTLGESDPEVSEAIDFCRFYADSARSIFTSCPGWPAQRHAASWSSFRRGIFRWRFPAAAWRRRWRPATPSFSSRRPTRCSSRTCCANVSGEPACRRRRCNSRRAAAARSASGSCRTTASMP